MFFESCWLVWPTFSCFAGTSAIESAWLSISSAARWFFERLNFSECEVLMPKRYEPVHPRRHTRRSPELKRLFCGEKFGEGTPMFTFWGSTVFVVSRNIIEDQYISPIPPPGGIAGIGLFSSGFSTIVASVVSSRPATDDAFSRAVRATFVGSITPALIRFS